MDISNAYDPRSVFAPAEEGRAPRVFIAPQRYIQGEGVLAHIGRYLSLTRAGRVAVLMSAGGENRLGGAVRDSLRVAGLEAVVRIFGGECSLEEVERHARALARERVDCVLAVGGGKCVDAGKAIAFRLDVPYAIAPTLASNDAPCSALSVMYTPEGVSSAVEFYPSSPALVVVDTGVVAAASERFLVAGMGDAMATWYEAAVCMRNPAAVTAVFARPTLAAAAIGERCAQTIYAQGAGAAAAVRRGVVDEALEAVVEANTLLSGLGFESGGVAAAHAFAQAFTFVPATHANHLHGEMVAMGTLAQLVLESRPDEARRVATFFAAVGLPVKLDQLSLDADDRGALGTVASAALAFPLLGNMPMALDAARLRDALRAADALGRDVSAATGDDAFRRLRAD